MHGVGTGRSPIMQLGHAWRRLQIMARTLIEERMLEVSEYGELYTRQTTIVKEL